VRRIRHLRPNARNVEPPFLQVREHQVFPVSLASQVSLELPASRVSLVSQGFPASREFQVSPKYPEPLELPRLLVHSR
jgi:hypothetical protein